MISFHFYFTFTIVYYIVNLERFISLCYSILKRIKLTSINIVFRHLECNKIEIINNFTTIVISYCTIIHKPVKKENFHNIFLEVRLFFRRKNILLSHHKMECTFCKFSAKVRIIYLFNL